MPKQDPTHHGTLLGAAECRRAMSAWKFRDEDEVVKSLLSQVPYTGKASIRIEQRAAEIVQKARADTSNRPLLDTFLTEYGLSNREGVALMCVAESLLRIPDQRTAERLIADKIQFGDWASHSGRAGSLLVNASTWALMLGSKMVSIDREFSANPGKWLGQLSNRISEPVIESAMRSAMRILGREFVLGTTIEKAVNNSDSNHNYSYDMLGEAARDARTAQRYFDSYVHAIDVVGGKVAALGTAASSVSIKLSALHPRYEFSQRQRVLEELLPIAKQLCIAAEKNNLELTIDAEEADRLDLSLDVFDVLARDPELKNFPGLGIVVQAYGKRAMPLLDWLVALAGETRRKFPVRLVKGAYWDAEIKHAQTHGYAGFPIFTRKPSTDLSYLVCAQRILQNPDRLAGQFATHNAHTVSAVMEMAEKDSTFEFQRLHGMGATLYEAVQDSYPEFPSLRTYAPVGAHDDLLAYLVRRLLENGANSSFVNRFLDEALAPTELVRDPVTVVHGTTPHPHPAIALPSNIFAPQRKNSMGVDLSDNAQIERLQSALETSRTQEYHVTPLTVENVTAARIRPVINPANQNDVLGDCIDCDVTEIDAVFRSALKHQAEWDVRGGHARAMLIEAFADSLEQEREHFVAILSREAGKTLPDAIDEIREAIDFCRYYAVQSRDKFGVATKLPGPTGESNALSLHGRGVFVCISPWNFPLAIFLGQVTAALCAGNTVIAKPAEETPIVAYEAIRLLHTCGVPVGVCQLVLGDGAIGEALVKHAQTSGVAFTGGTDTAHRINRSMAESVGPIAPLIAETGGQNAMVVDSSALLEQVTDDVISSAFLSAGQRCSALRVLFLQKDIAENALDMIRGAMDELCVGDPARLYSDVGPIISQEALSSLLEHVRQLSDRGQFLHQATLSSDCAVGTFLAPTMLEISNINELNCEHFGPILHVVRFHEKDFDNILEQISSTGYGLTFGIHTRIETRIAKAAGVVGVGNVYANRNMTGAVVGSQPFGGQRLSGTGPKAGGPNYLLRFATERVVTVNTVATGGNAELLTLDT